MGLASLQLALRDLIGLRTPTVDPNDFELAAYVERVSCSGRVPIVAEIIRSWRRYDLESSCPLTVMALKNSMLWEEALTSFERNSQSPFVELLADRFLEQMATHLNPRVAEVARFERSLMTSARSHRMNS